ncbi:unnamed protein product [Soboliphyme baturini]|uniref:J domain-containing protein n=1 Tax=Soboliphyme baturini TaxID=241478 RepID=A0A3P8BU89_9BILA|nr:unnamed protein product [Soboliphyme baturini]
MLGNEAGASLDNHLKLAKKFLSSGHLADALAQYHAALGTYCVRHCGCMYCRQFSDLDSNSYLSLFGRATVYQAMGKPNAALSDLDKVVKLKPDFSAISKGVQAEVAANKLALLHSVRQNVVDADSFLNKGDYESAEKMYSKILEVCIWNAEARMKRAQCYENMGDLSRAVADIRSSVKFLGDSGNIYLKLSDLYYLMGDVQEARNQIHEFLKLDPDNKASHTRYKKLKEVLKLVKEIEGDIDGQRWQNCVNAAKKLLQVETSVLAVIMIGKTQLCKCSSQAEMTADAIKICTETLDVNPRLLNTLCDRAEAYIQNGQYDKAIKDYKDALNIDRINERARSGLDKAERLLKQSKRKDYYAILGVKPTAKRNEILKAYRKLAQKWHPDNFRNGAKKEAEAKFLDIAAAKEVLTDPNKRQQFDSGIDPLDPEMQQQQHGGHPFYGFQGFNPFGHDGPFTFKFHFT